MSPADVASYAEVAEYIDRIRFEGNMHLLRIPNVALEFWIRGYVNNDPKSLN
jgi:hypothetical protein